jgi:hypothetical protein
MNDFSFPSPVGASGGDARVERLENLYYGKYRGIVTHNADPEQLGRLRLLVPSLFGGTFDKAKGKASNDDLVTDWATPCAIAGGFENLGVLFIPEVGAEVWVEFEEGNLDCPIWVGTFWTKPGGKSELPKPNKKDGSEESAVQDPPTRKIIKTAKGHSIQFEDKDGDELVTIVHRVDKNDKKKLNVITLDASGITLTDFTGNKIEMTDGAFTITSKVDFTLDASGKAVEIKASTIDLTKA